MTTSVSGPRTTTFLLRQPRQVQGFQEVLAEEVALTMLWIPPGRFSMGSPETEPERNASEGPQRLVQLPGFFMGQTPITQAQWRTVAEWAPPEGERPGEHWGRELKPNPSRFSGQPDSDQRPVEQVSWYDAMEYCQRLSRRTGRAYTLPSEAQWEYACRAGSSTPFHFGATITPELANYDGNTTYGDGPKGVYREQTTPVGMFPANPWGLQDMHGNVWEWCLDHWHGSHEGAPNDGSAWVNPPGESRVKTTKEGRDASSKEESRLLRGGSWRYFPGSCRSATRGRNLPDFANYLIGFRVVCLPQGPFP